MKALARKYAIRFSIKAVLAVVAVLCLALMCFRHIARIDQEQQKAISLIEQEGAFVAFDYNRGSLSNRVLARLWRTLTGRDSLASVVTVQLSSHKVIDGSATTPSDLSIDFSDHDLALLAPFPDVEVLALGHTQISNCGILYLSQFANLRELHLDSTSIDDNAIVFLSAMKNLRILTLTHTDISDKGSKKLEEALPDTLIWGPAEKGHGSQARDSDR